MLPPLIPRDDPKQRLRLQRFFMALGTYAVATLLLGVYLSQGLLAFDHYLIGTAAILVANLGIYVYIRSGRNLRCRDPSLTGAQIMIANGLLMVTFYLVDEGRGALLLLYVVTYIFGIFRLHTRQFFLLGGLGLAAYGVTIGMLWLTRPQAVDLRQELIQWVALGFVLPWFALVGGYISSLRHRLRQNKQELEEALERIRELAIRDDLTGAHNRRYIMELLEHEAGRCDRTGTPLSLLLLDIDHFKAINDRYGHREGDETLRRVAQGVRESLRPADGFGRYGGEEFIVVMADTDTEAARTAAERIRRIAAAIPLDDVAEGLRITVSVGVARYEPQRGIDDAFRRADRALYTAKATGRNRVAVAGQDDAAADGAAPPSAASD